MGLLAVTLALIISSTGYGASGRCDLYASPAGSDAAPGTLSSPLRTVQHLADSLRAGQVGCLREGAYGAPASSGTYEELKVTQPGIQIQSAPGELATINARVWVARGANGVTFEDLVLNGANARDLPSPTVNADDASFIHDEVTNDHSTICFDLGNVEYGEARGTLIEGSRIHACGGLPSSNQQHGIYLSDAAYTVIRGNWIYDNANRGIQLYPDAQNTVITGNVIYGNGEGIIFSGNGEVAANGSVVTHNVIAGASIRRNVESYYPEGGPIGTGNEVEENCVYGAPTSFYAGGDQSGIQAPQQGFVATDNVIASPAFVNAAAGNFRLAGGACASVATEPPAGEAPGPATLGAAAEAAVESPPSIFGEVESSEVAPEESALAPSRRQGGGSAVAPAKPIAYVRSSGAPSARVVLGAVRLGRDKMIEVSGKVLGASCEQARVFVLEGGSWRALRGRPSCRGARFSLRGRTGRRRGPVRVQVRVDALFSKVVRAGKA
jgi:parallel beta-helix repeat protein